MLGKEERKLFPLIPRIVAQILENPTQHDISPLWDLLANRTDDLESLFLLAYFPPPKKKDDYFKEILLNVLKMTSVDWKSPLSQKLDSVMRECTDDALKKIWEETKLVVT